VLTHGSTVALFHTLNNDEAEYKRTIWSKKKDSPESYVSIVYHLSNLQKYLKKDNHMFCSQTTLSIGNLYIKSLNHISKKK
jgi:hypothetical protein